MSFKLAVVQPMTHCPPGDDRNVTDAVQYVEQAAAQGGRRGRQTAHEGVSFALRLCATLTPRRFVSIPLVCTFHDCASAEALKRLKRKKSNVAKNKEDLVAIAPIWFAPQPDSLRPFPLS